MKVSDHRNAEGDFRERNTFESHDISWKSDCGGEMLSWFGPTQFDTEKCLHMDFSIRPLEREPGGPRNILALAEV